MADVERINSYSGSGLSIQHGKPTTPSAPEMPAGARAGQGGVVRVNTHTGQIETEGVIRASDAPLASSADPFDTGMTQTGFRRARHQLTQDDLVMHEGVETRIRELLSLGLAEPDPAGGFRMKAQQPSSSQQQQEDTPRMERLSNEAEATITTVVSKLGEANAIAIVRQIAEGKEMPAAGEYASRLGMEPQEFAQMIERTADEYRGQAMRALNMDSETYEEFSQWAMQADPDTAREAVLNAFDRSDYKLARQLAERFQREGASGWTDAELAEMPLGNGADSMAVSKDERGRPLITIPGYGTMLLRAAIQQKLVSVRRG
jgi:hypothetical protein